MGSLTHQFDELLARSGAAYNETQEVSYESTLVAILNFSKEHADNEAELVEVFKRLVKTGPLEVVAFCMRELQWPEIRNFVLEELASTQDPSDRRVLHDLLSVYDPVWPDSDLYEYYQR